MNTQCLVKCSSETLPRWQFLTAGWYRLKTTLQLSQFVVMSQRRASSKPTIKDDQYRCGFRCGSIDHQYSPDEKQRRTWLVPSSGYNCLIHCCLSPIEIRSPKLLLFFSMINLLVIPSKPQQDSTILLLMIMIMIIIIDHMSP